MQPSLDAPTRAPAIQEQLSAPPELSTTEAVPEQPLDEEPQPLEAIVEPTATTETAEEAVKLAGEVAQGEDEDEASAEEEHKVQAQVGELIRLERERERA